jgi:hypothetical protein
MKGPLNPSLNVGDVVICYHMDGETSVSPGTKGVVKNISKDPFEPNGELIYNVEWENGSTLGLLTSQDAWKKVPKKTIEEQDKGTYHDWKFITENPDIYEHFDWKWFREYLRIIRDSGIINMFASPPLLYAGRNHIDRYYGEGREDEEEFQEVLDGAEDSKNKIIQGVISYMNANNISLDDMDEVNRFAGRFSKKLVSLYVTLSGLTGNVS